MPLVVRPCWCSSLNALHIGTPEERTWCSNLWLLLHVLASLAVNRCCQETNITGDGVVPDSLMSAACEVVRRTPMMDLACRFWRSWRSSCLPTSLESHLCSLPYSATTSMQRIWTAERLSGTPSYSMVSVQILASAPLPFYMHRLCCSLNLTCASIQRHGQFVAYLLNRMIPFLTLVFAVRIGQLCFLWPCLVANSAASMLVILNYSPHLVAHSMLSAAHQSNIVRTWLASLPVATQLRLSNKQCPAVYDRYSSTHSISPEVLIAKRIGETSERCGTPGSPGCPSMALPSIIISAILSDRQPSVDRIRSQSICLTLIQLTSLPLAGLGMLL